MTPAPAYDHQFSVTKLTSFLDVFVTEHDLGVVLVAPFDVRLPRRLADPVEPDLIFFRKGNEPQSGDKLFTGVPDLVVEVLSPKTRRIDKGTKLEIYQEAGIPEYWLVDPLSRTVVTFRLGDAGVYVETASASEGKTVTRQHCRVCGLPYRRSFRRETDQLPASSAKRSASSTIRPPQRLQAHKFLPGVHAAADGAEAVEDGHAAGIGEEVGKGDAAAVGPRSPDSSRAPRPARRLAGRGRHAVFRDRRAESPARA